LRGCHLKRIIPELLGQRRFHGSDLWAGNSNALRLASGTYRGEALLQSRLKDTGDLSQISSAELKKELSF